MGVYDAGWDVLRSQRQARAKQLGIIPADSDMVRMSSTGDWDSFSAEQQRYHAKRMAVYAGMVDAMDHHIGRLVDYLKRSGQYDNTVFIFTSDNGSEASGGDNPRSPLLRLSLAMQSYNNNYETLGLKGSFNFIGPSFASAAAGPLDFYKFYAGEGGMRVPLIFAGAALPAQPRQTNALAYVTDIAPTILQLAGVSSPSSRYGGRPVEQMVGRSLLPLLSGEVQRVYSESDTIGYELAGNAALFQGDYKIVRNRGPVGDGRWHLYNIVVDPGEANDLSESMPQRLQSMLAEYEAYASHNGVRALPDGYNEELQGVLNGVKDRFGPQLLLAVLTLLILIGFHIAYRSRRRS
jgi:arylsulfatase/uncharacterized sulfatase